MTLRVPPQNPHEFTFAHTTKITQEHHQKHARNYRGIEYKKGGKQGIFKGAWKGAGVR